MIRAPWRRIQKIIQVRTITAVRVTRPSKTSSTVPSNSAPTTKMAVPTAAEIAIAAPVPHQTTLARPLRRSCRRKAIGMEKSSADRIAFGGALTNAKHISAS